MKIRFNRQFLHSVSAVAFASLVNVSAITGIVASTTTPAMAQLVRIVLTNAEAGQVSTSLTAAIQAASGASAGIEAAITASVVNFTRAAGVSGAAKAASLTSVVIAVAEKAGATPAQIGIALAQAAVALGPPASDEIAKALGAEGNALELVAFDTTVNGLGASRLASLADAAGNTATGALGGATRGNNGFAGNGASASAGCLNPSCTGL